MDPYKVLGLQHGATEDEAKIAFRTLAKTCHPDLHPNDPAAEQRFKDINAAYDTICKGGSGPKIESFSFRTGNTGFDPNAFHGFASGHFGDIFKEFRTVQRNADTHLECRLTLEEAFNGKELNITVPNGRATRNVKLNVPAGIGHGMRMSVAGGGSQTNPTQPAGDLYVIIRIMPHDRFIRDGSNLHTVAPVSVFDVLLGGEISITSIEGKPLTVSIPTSFDSSKKLRLAGQGMPDPFNGTRGDILVELFVDYPVLNEAQLDFIRQAAKTTEVTV